MDRMQVSYLFAGLLPLFRPESPVAVNTKEYDGILTKANHFFVFNGKVSVVIKNEDSSRRTVSSKENVLADLERSSKGVSFEGHEIGMWHVFKTRCSCKNYGMMCRSI